MPAPGPLLLALLLLLGGPRPAPGGPRPPAPRTARECPGRAPHPPALPGPPHPPALPRPPQPGCRRGGVGGCLLPAPAKAGLCPRKRAGRTAPACASGCANGCAHDHDCPGTHKCCFSGCGLACTPPQTGRQRAAAKPGACPVVLRGSLGPCLELCDGDGDCAGATKCCTTGCGHVCKPPTEVRPGLCPPMADGDRAAECLLLCLQDKACPPGQKCCLRDCGRACVPPLRGTA